MPTSQRGVAIIFAGLVLTICLGLVACGITTTAGTGGADTGAAPQSAVNSTCGPSPTITPGTPGFTPGVQGSIVPRFTPGTIAPFNPTAMPTVTQASPLTPVPNASITSGKVTVTVNHSSYGPCDSIQVIIANGLASAIAVADHQTSCSVVTVEVQVNGGWQPVDLCPLMAPTRLYMICNGTAVAETVHPAFGSIRGRQQGGGGISPQGAGQGTASGAAGAAGTQQGASSSNASPPASNASPPSTPPSNPTAVPQPYGWPSGTYRVHVTYFQGGRSQPVSQQPAYSSTFTVS